MDIGKELRVIDVDEPRAVPAEAEPVRVEDPTTEPAEANTKRD